MNSHERHARAKKVAKLVAAIDLLDQPPPPDDVADWGPRTWEILAQVANVRTPSAETVAAVVSELRGRERRTA